MVKYIFFQIGFIIIFLFQEQDWSLTTRLLTYVTVCGVNYFVVRRRKAFSKRQKTKVQFFQEVIFDQTKTRSVIRKASLFDFWPEIFHHSLQLLHSVVLHVSFLLRISAWNWRNQDDFDIWEFVFLKIDSSLLLKIEICRKHVFKDKVQGFLEIFIIAEVFFDFFCFLRGFSFIFFWKHLNFFIWIIQGDNWLFELGLFLYFFKQFVFTFSFFRLCFGLFGKFGFLGFLFVVWKFDTFQVKVLIPVRIEPDEPILSMLIACSDHHS